MEETGSTAKHVIQITSPEEVDWNAQIATDYRKFMEATEKGWAVTYALQAAQVNATLALQQATLRYASNSEVYQYQAIEWLKEAGYWKE